MAGGAEGSGIRFEVLLISRSHPLSSARAGGMIVPYETLYSNSAVAVYMEDPEGRPVWKVTLQLRGGGYVFAQLDARTGDALITDTGKTDVYRNWRQYVTEEYG